MSFTTTVIIEDEEVEVDVDYDYEGPDESVGFSGGMVIESVLDNDGEDVFHLLTEEGRDQIFDQCKSDRKRFAEFLQDI